MRELLRDCKKLNLLLGLLLALVFDTFVCESVVLQQRALCADKISNCYASTSEMLVGEPEPEPRKRALGRSIREAAFRISYSYSGSRVVLFG